MNENLKIHFKQRLYVKKCSTKVLYLFILTQKSEASNVDFFVDEELPHSGQFVFVRWGAGTSCFILISSSFVYVSHIHKRHILYKPLYEVHLMQSPIMCVVKFISYRVEAWRKSLPLHVLSLLYTEWRYQLLNVIRT